MKRVISCFMLLFSLFLIGCTKITPLENPELELFSSFHVGDDFTIFKRTEIDPNQLYYQMAYKIISPKGYLCWVGSYEKMHYIVLFENEYYDIIGGSQLKLYSSYDLISWGVNVSCQLDDQAIPM